MAKAGEISRRRKHIRRMVAMVFGRDFDGMRAILWLSDPFIYKKWRCLEGAYDANARD